MCSHFVLTESVFTEEPGPGPLIAPLLGHKFDLIAPLLKCTLLHGNIVILVSKVQSHQMYQEESKPLESGI